MSCVLLPPTARGLSSISGREEKRTHPRGSLPYSTLSPSPSVSTVGDVYAVVKEKIQGPGRGREGPLHQERPP